MHDLYQDCQIFKATTVANLYMFPIYERLNNCYPREIGPTIKVTNLYTYICGTCLIVPFRSDVIQKLQSNVLT